jgi:hypothetical protein
MVSMAVVVWKGRTITVLIMPSNWGVRVTVSHGGGEEEEEGERN